MNHSNHGDEREHKIHRVAKKKGQRRHVKDQLHRIVAGSGDIEEILDDLVEDERDES